MIPGLTEVLHHVVQTRFSCAKTKEEDRVRLLLLVVSTMHVRLLFVFGFTPSLSLIRHHIFFRHAYLVALSQRPKPMCSFSSTPASLAITVIGTASFCALTAYAVWMDL